MHHVILVCALISVFFSSSGYASGDRVANDIKANALSLYNDKHLKPISVPINSRRVAVEESAYSTSLSAQKQTHYGLINEKTAKLYKQNYSSLSPALAPSGRTPPLSVVTNRDFIGGRIVADDYAVKRLQEQADIRINAMKLYYQGGRSIPSKVSAESAPLDKVDDTLLLDGDDGISVKAANIKETLSLSSAKSQSDNPKQYNVSGAQLMEVLAGVDAPLTAQSATLKNNTKVENISDEHIQGMDVAGMSSVGLAAADQAILLNQQDQMAKENQSVLDAATMQNLGQTYSDKALKNNTQKPNVTLANNTQISDDLVQASATHVDVTKDGGAPRDNQDKSGEYIAKKMLGNTMPSGASFSKDSSVVIEQDTEFIKSLAGTDGLVTLNVAQSSFKPDVPEPLYLDEAVAFALKNNFEVRASNEKLRSSYWDKVGAYAQYVPSVEFSVANGLEISDPASYNDTNGDRARNDKHRRLDRSLTVRQPIVDLAIVADILAGHDKEKAAKSDNREARDSVALDTVNTFYKLVQARIAVRLADQYRNYLEDLSSRMGARVEGGGGTNADLDRIKGRATLAEAARVEAVGDYETNISSFKRLTKVLPSGLKIPSVLAPAVPSDPDGALDIAVKSNPSYLSSLAKIDMAGNDRNKSLSTMLPKLSLQYNKSFIYNAGGAAKGNPVDGSYPSQTTESVMVVAQWALNSGTPITGGFSGAAKEREMRLRSEDVRARLEESVRSGYTAVNAASERETILQKAVAANQRVVNSFEEQYNTGGRSLFDLLDAYEQLYNSKLNLMRVVIAKTQAMYLIRKQMGELIPSVMSVVRE